MKKFLILCLAVLALVCALAVSVSADNFSSETTVTLSDGTVLDLYNEEGESLLWFILSTDENGVNTYASVPVNRNTADNATSYVTYKINSQYGTNQMHDVYIKYWDSETSSYVSYAEGTIVVANFRTFEQEYWSIGSVFSSANLEYMYHSSTARDSGGFKSYKKLQIVDLSLTTNFETFSEQAFSGCTELRIVRIGNSETGYGLTCKNGNLFNGCTKLTTLEFANIADVNTIVANAFYNCHSLTGTYTFPSVTTIENQAFRYCAKNEDTYLVLNFPSIESLGTGTGDTNVFSNSGIEEITFGSNLSHMSYNTFTSCSRLWRIEFAGVAEGFNFPSYTFDGCSALVAFSVPEGMTTLPQRMFRSCTSLKAVYLPSTLTKIDSGSQDHATFSKCTNLYFVSSPFTYDSVDDIPAKPDVYYFPAGITDISTGEVFKNCASLNKTLVFGTGVTSAKNAWMFEAGTSTPTLENIVFLGDMVEVSTSSSSSSWRFTGKIYFANANDKSSSDVSLSNLASKSVFCFADGNTTHLTEKTLSTDATCESPAMIANYCFCGQINGTPETSGEALGHLYNLEAVYEFTTLTVAGVQHIGCANGCGTTQDTPVDPVVVDKGFSVALTGTKAFSNGFLVNTDVLKLYEQTKGVKVELGYVMTGATDAFGALEEVTIDSFKIKVILKRANSDFAFNSFDYRITYSNEAYLDSDIVISAYAIENGEVSYFQNDTSNAELNMVNGFVVMSYNDAVNLAPKD